MNDTQSLELQIKSTGEQTLKILNQLNETLTGMSSTLSKVSTNAKGIENIGKASQKAISNVDRLGNSFKRIFSFVGAKMVATKAMDFLDSAVNRAEELNLFNVIFKNVEKDGVKTFSTLGEEATRFQNKMNEAFGTNKTETLRYQGLFQAMAINQGISDKYATIMSENMLKLTYDLASLYNRSEQTTAEALRGGVYAGQTKPLRGYGIDVTQQSLKPVLASLGITDRSVSEMNQAEKEILRYISTLNQARAAMGDFAETIESPANQLKIFKQQLVEAKTAWGNLFMGMYADILPYANAILMVLKEIAKAIANMLNLETRDFNTGIASLEDTYDGFEDIGKGASNATKAAKELKRQILDFDQIHNITTPSNTGSLGGTGSGVGLAGGIDKRLLDAIDGYDNLMDKVRMKANDIRDRWMEILGFQKVLNPLTGEYEFKYQGLSTTIKNLWNKFMDLNPQMRLFVSLLTGAGIVKFVGLIGKLSKSLGVSGLLKNVTGLFSPLKTMFEYTRVYNNLIGDSETGVRKLSSAMSSGIDRWKETASTGERVSAGLKGLAMTGGGLWLMKNAFDDIAESGANVINIAEGVGGAFGTIFGSIQTGAAIGGSTGAIIGGVVGTIGSLITAIKGIAYANDEVQQRLDKTTKLVTDKYDEWKKSVESLQESYGIVDSEMNYYQNLYNELTGIVDQNGKIKEGYEDRAKFITGQLSEAFGVEIKVVDNVITEYDKLKDKVQEAIDKEKARLKLVALEEKAKEAIAKEEEARQNLARANQELQEAQEEYNNSLLFGNEVNILTIGKLKQAQANYDTAKKTLDGYTNTIRDWEKATELSVTGNTEQLNWYFDHESKLYGKSQQEKYQYWNDLINENKIYLSELEKDRNNYTESEYNARKVQYENEIELAKKQQENLRLVVKTSMGNINNDVVSAWVSMANESTTEFMRNFTQLPQEMQDTLLNKLKGSGFKISSQLQEELDKNKPKLTIKSSVDNTSLNSAVNTITKKFLNIDLSKYTNKARGGVYNGTSWSNIPQYANGGSPSHGSLVWAGENGPEILANANRRTEILNKSQIASSIYSAVVSAMSQFNGGTTKVELIAHTDEGVIIDRINQKTKQTGRCPINLPSY